jgi:serine/threonine protein kinase/tetratricopeptide (TPR) repeat protein
MHESNDDETRDAPTSDLTSRETRATQASSSDDSLHVPLPSSVGKYRILSLIGEGGMGSVYKAEQDSPRRTVALKVIKAGVASGRLLHRFEIEAQILGKLDHPGIATIFEAGTFGEGQGAQPFFAMEFVQGQELLDYADSKKLGTRERLKLLARIAEAVQHAHQKGVIHRDLKPGNILVTYEGQVKILDFGVARATDADIQTATMQTDIGQLIGTIPYMSPEQASGNPDDLDTRSDVYALGVIAYELLTGHMPYDLKQKMIHEAVRVIQYDEPRSLSTLNRTLRGDVEIIVGKALVKEKERRYQSASDFASDIERYLSNEPIEARAPSTWYQLSKFSRRNKALVAGVLAVLMVSIAGTLISINFAKGEAAQKKVALEAAEEARIAKEDAETAQAEEAKRADELEQVAAFQSNQLNEFDAAAMGRTIRAGLASKLSEVSIRRGLGDDESSSIVEQYVALVAGADFTGLALDSLDEHIFTPSMQSIRNDFADQPLVRARLLDALAWTLANAGLPEQAADALKETLDIRQEQLGEDHLETLDVTNNLGDTYRDLGEYELANQSYLRALSGYRKVLGEEDPDTLVTMNNVASSLSDTGEYDQAAEQYKEVMEIQARVLGADHPDTLLTAANLGANYRDQGDFPEAEKYNRIALEGMQRTLGEDDQNTMTVMGSLGLLLFMQGNLEEAEPYLYAAYEGRRRVLGDKHPDTLGSMINMGNLYNGLGKTDLAEPLFREAVETSQGTLGADHPSTLMSKFMLGSFLLQVGNLTEAERYTRESLEGMRRVLGHDHPDTIAAVINMGYLLRTQGKLDEATPYQQESTEASRRELGDQHPSTLVAIGSLALLQRDIGNLPDAERLMRESLDGFRMVLGDQHPHTQTTFSFMAGILEDQGKWAESEEYRVINVQHYRDSSMDDGSSLASALVRLSTNLLAQDRHNEAQRLLSECLEIRDEVLPEGHWLIWNTRSMLGEALAAQFSFVEAEGLLIEAAEQINPPESYSIRREEAVQRVIDLYTAWHAAEPGNGHDLQAEQWRQRLESTD